MTYSSLVEDLEDFEADRCREQDEGALLSNPSLLNQLLLDDCHEPVSGLSVTKVHEIFLQGSGSREDPKLYPLHYPQGYAKVELMDNCEDPPKTQVAEVRWDEDKYPRVYWTLPNGVAIPGLNSVAWW